MVNLLGMWQWYGYFQKHSPVLSILNYAPYVIYEIKKFTKIRFKKFDLLEIKREIICIVSWRYWIKGDFLKWKAFYILPIFLIILDKTSRMHKFLAGTQKLIYVKCISKILHSVPEWQGTVNTWKLIQANILDYY